MKTFNIAVKLSLSAFFAMLFSGCNSAGTNGDKVSDTESDTDTNSEEAGGMDSDSGSLSVVSCEGLHDYAVSCEIDAATLTQLDSGCLVMSALFTDTFLEGMLDCLSPSSCDELVAMLESGGTDTDIGTDTAAPTDPFSRCVITAMTTSEPEASNVTFEEHYCDYAMQCDASLSAGECALSFKDPSRDLFIYGVLGEPYITNADACVYPTPACSDEVDTCLTGVLGGIGDTLSSLGGGA